MSHPWKCPLCGEEFNEIGPMILNLTITDHLNDKHAGITVRPEERPAPMDGWWPKADEAAPKDGNGHTAFDRKWLATCRVLWNPPRPNYPPCRP